MPQEAGKYLQWGPPAGATTPESWVGRAQNGVPPVGQGTLPVESFFRAFLNLRVGGNCTQGKGDFMRKLLILLPLLALPMSALAQETPKVEVFGGYSNLISNFTNSSIDMNGVNFAVQENVNSWFGGVLDFSTHFGSENQSVTGLSTTTTSFRVNTQSLTYGPVFTYRKSKTVTPFGHAMVGGVRGGPEYLGISQPEFRFGVYAGGGLDVKVSPMISLRLIQADYLMSRFSGARQEAIPFLSK